MAKKKTLTIAIDETGNFTRQKLEGTGNFAGIIAVAINGRTKPFAEWFKRNVETIVETSAADLHAMQMTRDDPATVEKLATLQDRIVERSVFVCGVHGAIPDRTFYHEQQAYGETLEFLLWRIGHEHGATLREYECIRIFLSGRRHPQLVGFTDADEYHSELAQHVENALDSLGWPKRVRKDIQTPTGTQNNLCRAADVLAFMLGRGDKKYSKAIANLAEDPGRPRLISQLYSLDPVNELVSIAADGKHLKASTFERLGKDTRETLFGRLGKVISDLVTKRFSDASLPIAEKLVDYLGDVFFEDAKLKGDLSDNERSFAVELCMFAAEIASHSGKTEGAEFTVRWVARAEGLETFDWDRDLPRARSMRLWHRLQALHLRYFHQFRFVDAHTDMLNTLNAYEEREGDASIIPDGDELHAAILGSLGQAHALMRSSDPESVDDEAYALTCFQLGQRHLTRAESYIQAMNVGFQLTELWDRELLEEATILLDESDIPAPADCDVWSLLHRLRLHSLGMRNGSVDEAKRYEDALLERLLSVSGGNETRATHPHDLTLKWGIYLNPESAELRDAARDWLGGLGSEPGVLDATSLPLRLQAGDPAGARAAVKRLVRLPGFRSHWDLPRAQPLREAVENGQTENLSYEALTGMPWYYA